MLYVTQCPTTRYNRDLAPILAGLPITVKSVETVTNGIGEHDTFVTFETEDKDIADIIRSAGFFISEV